MCLAKTSLPSCASFLGPLCLAQAEHPYWSMVTGHTSYDFTVMAAADPAQE